MTYLKQNTKEIKNTIENEIQTNILHKMRLLLLGI